MLLTLRSSYGVARVVLWFRGIPRLLWRNNRPPRLQRDVAGRTSREAGDFERGPRTRGRREEKQDKTSEGGEKRDNVQNSQTH